MKEILSAKGIPYFHFVQPNQYYPTNRRFSEEEKKIAFSESQAFGEGVRKGYPKLLTKVSGLQQSGVRVFSGVNIFDDVGNIVYVDNCCHYNELGKQIFSTYVARSILKTLSTPPHPTSER